MCGREVVRLNLMAVSASASFVCTLYMYALSFHFVFIHFYAILMTADAYGESTNCILINCSIAVLIYIISFRENNERMSCSCRRTRNVIAIIISFLLNELHMYVKVFCKEKYNNNNE